MAEAIEIGLGLGSNLGRPPHNIRRALAALAERGVMHPKAVSSIYRTAPWGFEDQNDFANAAVIGTTRLDPAALLAEVKAVEKIIGRTESIRWGPRIIDVDILFYGDVALTTPSLTIPHRDLFARAFVLIPLAEVAPTLRIAGRSVAQAAAAAERDEIRLWTELTDDSWPDRR